MTFFQARIIIHIGSIQIINCQRTSENPKESQRIPKNPRESQRRTIIDRSIADDNRAAKA
jgi:hypothetical protein